MKMFLHKLRHNQIISPRKEIKDGDWYGITRN
jgi:hypothetical protein